MNWRYSLVFGVFVVAFLLVFSRLFYWQVIRAEELSLMGQMQYGRNIVIMPKRGEIKTSDGFPIATQKISYLVYANPKNIKELDKNKVSRLLSSILDTDVASISGLLNRNLLWVSLGIVGKEKKDEIEKFKLDGIDFEQHFSRFYPEASTAAHLVGFVGKDNEGEDKGYFGLEGFYNRQLRGKPGILRQINDAMGRPIIAKMSSDEDKIDGRSLNLHIDRVIQFIVEKKLKYGIDKYGASGGMIAVINPKTGGILAMSAFPAFDQKNYDEYRDELFKNPFITSLYEPGSTFKSLIMASAIDAGLVRPDTKCPICSAPITIGEYEIKTWNNKYIKNITMTEVIKHSDNTGMVYVSRVMGLKNMMIYFKKFGIGDITGIDLQGEVSPIARKNWYPIDIATASFGQGISMTPLELLVGFSAIANEGKRMEPHIVASIDTADGKNILIPPKEINAPISSRTARIMTEMLVNAVNNGEAKWAKPKGYRIAGKTGTSQIPIAGHYDVSKTIASFIGFAPADDPKFAMLVILDRPTTSIYGADTAAPIFFSIARDIFNHYGIMPKE
ncbi:penicillin-binding protein [Candidatus Levyibacteriota bacterium]|nr:penicillin-binding protein 2 [Candidatus Levybacteria bacterium]GDX61872.1 penicillin-binding protein [Candidatus Levybacteria bacterium]